MQGFAGACLVDGSTNHEFDKWCRLPAAVANLRGKAACYTCVEGRVTPASREEYVNLKIAEERGGTRRNTHPVHVCTVLSISVESVCVAAGASSLQ
jgi:hypothetical protein